jgi:superfamily II DNA/RNA helicase
MWDNFIKERYNAKETLKTVFFIGRKTTAQEFKKDLLNITGLGEDDISILNSDVAKKDRENAMSKKIIISTSDSLGRGIDLKGLDTVVDLETRNSKSETVQVIGRVSRTGMTNVGTYIQLIDTAFETVKRNFETKMKYDFFDDHFTDMKVKEYF